MVVVGISNTIGKIGRTHFTCQINREGIEVTVCGFVKHVRVVGKIVFVVIADREGEIQVIFKKGEVSDELFEAAKKLTLQSVVAVRGVSRRKVGGGFEIVPKEMYVVSLVTEPLPIEVVEETTTYLHKRLDYRWLDLRRRKVQLIFKIRSDFERYIREFLYNEGFVEIHSAKIMGAPSESGANVFEINYFNRKAYLAQSPQFYKQMAIVGGLDKVFEVGPVFRAEPHHTVRHLCEFTSIDVEIAWIKDLEEIMSLEERMLKYVFEKIKEKYEDDVRKYYGVEIEVPKIPFPRLKFEEVKELTKGKTKNPTEPNDLSSEEERIIGKIIKEEYGHDFVFITDWPWEARPFYHMKTEDGKHTMSFDLLYKGLEITTGSIREHRYDVLVQQAKEKGLNLKNIEFYLNFFRWGAPPHGGFGLGPARVIMQMLGLENIREAELLPRDPERLFP